MFMVPRQIRLSLLVIAFASVVAGVACKSSSNKATGAGQKQPIGSACTKDSDCGAAPFYCMVEHPGGYCMSDCTTDADCPPEAICQNDGMKGECHSKCNAMADCRSGYECAPAANTATNKASHAFCDMIEPVDGGGADAN